MAGIPRPRFGAWEATNSWAFAGIAAACAAGCAGVLARLGRAPFGRTLKALRDDEIAAQSLGKHTPALKVQAFVIAGAIAAVSGALYAGYLSYIDPTVFYVDQAILLLTMVLLGGTGNVQGPLVGTVVIVLLPEALRFLHVPDTVAPQVRQMLFGLALVLTMRFRPAGLCGEYALR
jgi:branched-chain amino acid transport system permease protein